MNQYFCQTEQFNHKINAEGIVLFGQYVIEELIQSLEENRYWNWNHFSNIATNTILQNEGTNEVKKKVTKGDLFVNHIFFLW